MALPAVAYTVICVVAANILTAGTHRPLNAAASAVGPDVENVSFPSRIDHIVLRGWLAHSATRTGRSVIFVHGRDSNRVASDFGAVPLARRLLAAGYDVLLFDLRSSGQSGGDRFIIGPDQSRDVLGAYDFMRSRGYAPARMGVLGWSQGAVIMLEAAAQLRDVAALVSDSAYADIGPIIAAQTRSNSPLPPFFDWGIETAAQILFGFDPGLRPLDAVRALPARAFLFFQGAADTTVPPVNGEELRAASAAPQSRLVVVPRAGHVQSFHTQPQEYTQTLLRFLDQQISERGT